MFRVYNIKRSQIKQLIVYEDIHSSTVKHEILVRCHYERPILYWQTCTFV